MPDVVRFNGEKQEGVGFYEDVLKEKEAGARSHRLQIRSPCLPPSITPETEVGGVGGWGGELGVRAVAGA